MKLQIIEDTSNLLLLGIEKLIEQTGRNVAVHLNTEISRLYWSIGNHIVTEMQYETYSQHGQQILATLSQRLTVKFGKGYTYSALTRMIKIAQTYNEEMFATLSQALSWSHFIELVAIENVTKRLFYQQMCVIEQALPKKSRRDDRCITVCKHSAAYGEQGISQTKSRRDEIIHLN